MRELEKTLMEIESAIKDHERRGNTHTQSVLQIAHEIISVCAKYARTLPELEAILGCGGWMPVERRLPEKNEYFVDTSSNKDFPNGYYRRLEIAYMTDTIEYVHGYYDGYKWMDKYLNAIKNVVAWRIHEPYQPETETQRPEWKDRMLHTFLGGHHD